MNLTIALLQRVWLVILSLSPLAPVIFVHSPTASPSPSSAPFAGLPTHSQDPATPSPAPEISASIKLIIPVEGVRPNDLRDTFDAIRSGGRLHRAIDIIAPRGTPVLAATDGEIIRLSQNTAGGNTIYQMSDDKKLVFYYAHLDRYADDLASGDYARQGDVIGYVGNTGNASAGNCHLHFSIWAVTDPKKYWTGDNINPYPILRAADDSISERARN
jgi:peptidoglycan LD-endopeptidase LytH